MSKRRGMAMSSKIFLKPFVAALAKSHIAIALGCSCLAVEPADAQIGIPAIVAVCAPCHGADGTGGDVEKPNLAGQKSIYIRQQLEAFRAGRRKHPEMKSIARELTNREIDDLVVYYSTLSPL